MSDLNLKQVEVLSEMFFGVSFPILSVDEGFEERIKGMMDEDICKFNRCLNELREQHTTQNEEMKR